MTLQELFQHSPHMSIVALIPIGQLLLQRWLIARHRSYFPGAHFQGDNCFAYELTQLPRRIKMPLLSGHALCVSEVEAISREPTDQRDLSSWVSLITHFVFLF